MVDPELDKLQKQLLHLVNPRFRRSVHCIAQQRSNIIEVLYDNRIEQLGFFLKMIIK
ncbi:hypothetical protein D3C87_2009790 [compost metagenome]